MKRILKVLPLVALAALTVACDDFDMDFNGERYESPFHYSYDLKPGGRLEVETFNGSVEIRSWDQNKVDISGVKYANSTALRDAIRIEASGSPDSVSVRTIRPSDHHGNMGARYVIRVPKNIMLDRIVSSNGAVKVEDVSGLVHARTSNGGVTLSRVNGDVDAQTSNGGIHLEEVSGNAVLHTSNGHIQVDHNKGPVQAETSNGGIDIGFDTAPKSDIRATTSNSSITVTMPSSSGAHLRANTSNGSITTDFETTMQGSLSKTHLEGTVNGGGPLLDLSTSNGSIKILKP